MEIYLLEKETNNLIQTFNNVTDWAENYVCYTVSGQMGKIYCDTEIEYFSDEMPLFEENVDI